LEQSDGLDVVFGYAKALSIIISEVLLGLGVTLVGCFLEPHCGLSIILRDASARSIHDTDTILGTGNALFSKRA
jgi:hypothetical protein